MVLLWFAAEALRPGAAPTTAMLLGEKEGERSWPAAHGPGEEPEVRAPGPRLAPPWTGWGGGKEKRAEAEA